MKALANYPTPETDAAVYPMDVCDVVWPEHARDLERRLAACREALEVVLRRGYSMQRSDQYLREVLQTARTAITLTAPSTNPKP